MGWKLSKDVVLGWFPTLPHPSPPAWSLVSQLGQGKAVPLQQGLSQSFGIRFSSVSLLAEALGAPKPTQQKAASHSWMTALPVKDMFFMSLPLREEDNPQLAFTWEGTQSAFTWLLPTPKSAWLGNSVAAWRLQHAPAEL